MKIHGDSLGRSHRPSKDPGRLTPHEQQTRCGTCLPDMQGHLLAVPVEIVGYPVVLPVLDRLASVYRGKVDYPHDVVGGRSDIHHAIHNRIGSHPMRAFDPYRQVLDRQHPLASQHLPYQEREREDRDDGHHPIADVPRGQRFHDSSPNLAGPRLDHAGLVITQSRRGPGGPPNAARRIPPSDTEGGE